MERPERLWDLTDGKVMTNESFDLWERHPILGTTGTTIHHYFPEDCISDAAIIAIPGGAYRGLSQYEGWGFGEFFSYKGIHTFTLDYHVAPHRFPIQLLDARRTVRFVRAHAAEYGIDPNKIAVIGSSAGGHLAAMLCTYLDDIPGEGVDKIDEEDFMPNAQILCYPVICGPDRPDICHMESYGNLLGGRNEHMEALLDPSKNVRATTPPAFLWHTAEDASVNVINSYQYATALRNAKVPTELHVFPYGHHGMGVSVESKHNRQWIGLLLNWFAQMGWIKEKE